MGRQTIRTPDIDEAIISGLSEGTPLTVICRSLGIGLSTVYDWRDSDDEFAGNIARARDAGFDAIAMRLRETARGLGDSKQDVQRDKLIIETDLKLLAKWDKRYAEKVVNEHGGIDGKPIQSVTRVERVVIDPSNPDPA